MVVTSQFNGVNTSFISFTPSSRTVKWYTNTSGLGGIYYIRIYGYIQTYKSWSSYVQFKQTVIDGCSSTTETILITPSASLPNQILYSGYWQKPTPLQQPFTQNSTICTNDDIRYTLSCTSTNCPIQVRNDIFTDPSNSTLEYYLARSNANVGTYIISVIGHLYAQTEWNASSSFSVTVRPHCAGSIDAFSILYSSTSNQIYTIGSPATSYQIPAFSVLNSLYCTQSNIRYWMSVTPTISGQSTDFITFSDWWLRQATWISMSDIDIGTYIINMDAAIGTVPQNWIRNSTSFTLTVLGNCSLTSEIIAISTGQSLSSQSYIVGSPSDSHVINQFSENATWCSQDDISYSIEVIPSIASSDTTFISFAANSGNAGIVQWVTSDNSQADTYTVTIIGQIQALSTWSQTVSFTLTVIGSCKLSTETNSLTTSLLVDQSYIVGSASTSYTISQFIVSSQFCNQSDISYSMVVTPSIIGTDTTFINFSTNSGNAGAVSIYTTSNTMVGTYIVTITGSIAAASTWTKSISYTLTVTGSCLYSTEQISITAPTSVSQQNYGLATSQTSITITQFTENSIFCTSSDIVYSMTLTPTILGTPTSFISFISTTRVVSWQTSSSAQVGSYTIMITGTISANQSWSETTQFTLLVYDCPISPETIQISVSTPPSSQSYTVGAIVGSQLIAQFTENSAVCTAADIVYSMTVAPATTSLTTTFITFTPSTSTVAWITTDIAQVGAYTITVTGTIISASTWTQSTSFTLTVAGNCQYSTDTITINEGAVPDAQTYIIGTTSVQNIISQFTQTSLYCSQSNIVYSMAVTPGISGTPTSFITFTPSTRTVKWYTTMNTQVGTYTIMITGAIQAMMVWTKSITFTLTVIGSCAFSTETITLTVGSTLIDQSYTVGGTSSSYTISQFTEDSTFCTQSDIVYSMAVTPPTSGLSVSFISFTPSTIVVAWYTTSNAQVGAYTITITGKIQALTAWTQTTSFILTVLGSCSFSTETITLTTGQTLIDQSYTVGSSSQSYTISEFTGNSIFCTQSDISYSMAITPGTISTQTSFIIFTTSTRVVDWFTTSNTQVGSYKITITGKIQAVTEWTKSTSFVLTVTGSCAFSTETITLTVGSTLINQSYTVGGTSSSYTISQFIEDSTYCTQSDIVYSMAVTPATSGLSVSFITFTPSTRVVAWYTTSNPQVGTYTVTITGTIQAVSQWSQSTSFTLIVLASCAFSIETINLTAPSVIAQSYKVGDAASSYIISQFLEDSIYCTQAEIIYSMLVAPSISGTDTTFINFVTSSGNAGAVSFYTTSNTKVDTYTITIIGKIYAKSTWSQQTQFTLTVIGSCAFTTEAIVLTAGTTLTNQFYTVGSASSIYSISQFTENATYCNQTDIIYSMVVTPAGTSFINFTQSVGNDGTVTSYTYSNLNAGSYVVNIMGEINAVQTWSQSTSFIVTVIGTCDYSVGYNISAPSNLTNTSGTITYIQGQPMKYLALGNFTEDDAYCNQANITYFMTVTPTTPGQNYDFINYNPQENVANWYTNNKSDFGVYTIKFTGFINGVLYKPSNFTNFTLIVISADCATTSEIINITAPAKPMKQNYYTQKTGQLLIEDFIEDSEFCTSQDIIYSMIVTSEQAGQNTDFIAFNPSTKLVSWTSSSNVDAGNYTIEIIATLRDFNQTTSFQLELQVLPPPNHPPVLSALTSVYQTFRLSDMPEGFFNFGPITDIDPGETATLSYNVQPPIGNTYFNIDPLTGLFQISNLNGLVGNSISNYIIKVQLQDSNILEPARSSYVITFDVQNQKPNLDSKKNQQSKTEQNPTQENLNYTVIVDKSVPPPYWKSITTTNDGKVQLYFSEKLVIPSNATVLVNSSVLNLKILSQSAEYKKYQGFTWNLTEFTPLYMSLQINFQNPLYISCLGKAKLDQIQVSCLDNQFFLSMKSFQSIGKDSVLQKQLPAQLASAKSAKAGLKSAQSLVADGSNGLVLGTLIVNILLSGSISQLWGLLNSLQIIDHLTDFNIYVPANVKDFYNFIHDLQSYNFLPTDQIFAWLGLQSSEESQFDDAKNIFKKLGPLFLVLLCGCALFILLMLLYVPIKMCEICRIKSIWVKLYYKINFLLFWNSTLRYLIQSYISLALFSLQLANTGFDWSDNLNRVQSVFAIFIIAIIGVAPFIMTLYFRINLNLFQEQNFLQRFGSIIRDFNYKSKLSSCFISIFCYRRLVQVLLILYMGSYPYAQSQLQTLTCMFTFISFGVSNVYLDSKLRRIEFFNEATIILCCYHTFLFTDFVDDPFDRYNIGYSLIASTALNIGVQILLMMIDTVKNLVNFFKKILKRYRKWHHNQEEMKIKMLQKARNKQKVLPKKDELDMMRNQIDQQNFLKLYWYENQQREDKLAELKYQPKIETPNQLEETKNQRIRRLIIPYDLAVIKSRLSDISELSLNLNFDDDFEPICSKRKSVINEISVSDVSDKDISFRPRTELDLSVLQPQIDQISEMSVLERTSKDMPELIADEDRRILAQR